MSEKVETIVVPNTPKPIGPYSHVAKTGQFITISGTLGIDPISGQIIGEDVYSQAKQILELFKIMLESVGSDLNHIININVFLKNMDDFQAMNRAYTEVMGNHLPTRTVIGINELRKPGALVEMNLTAITK